MPSSYTPLHESDTVSSSEGETVIRGASTPTKTIPQLDMSCVRNDASDLGTPRNTTDFLSRMSAKLYKEFTPPKPPNEVTYTCNYTTPRRDATPSGAGDDDAALISFQSLGGLSDIQRSPELRFNTFVAVTTLILAVAAVLVSATTDKEKQRNIIMASSIPVFWTILFVTLFFYKSNEQSSLIPLIGNVLAFTVCVAMYTIYFKE